MPTPFSRSALRRRAALCALLVAPAAAGVQACTDLTETPRDALTPGNTFRSPTEVQAGVASVYAQLRGTMWEVYNLNEVTTDEQVVPTRGSDWFDNGRWLEIHRLGFTPNSGSGLEDVNGAWNNLFTGVSRANLVINSIEQNGVTGQEQAIAELRVLRAWYYYLLLDMFGGVPIVTTTEVVSRPRNTNVEVYNFIEQELTQAREGLQANAYAPTDANYGRVTQGTVDAILASLYLNAPVYTGTVSAAGLAPGQAQWQKAFDAANRVITSNQYTLATTPEAWRANFGTANDGAPEHIFAIRHVAADGLGMTLPMRALHYNQLDPAPWNGFAVTAEAYARFDTAGDARATATFLSGPQRSYVNNTPVNDRAGRPLVYTRNIANITSATEGEGVRLVKFPPLVGAPNGNHPNDFPLFRLAEMYLIRAEASYRLGNAAAAAADINTVRGTKYPARVTTVTDDVILNERLFEFAGEAKRRRDLIRFGRFTAPRQFKQEATPAYKVLFPIPVTQIGSNPQLAQNPGY
jgi:hypothetical protein